MVEDVFLWHLDFPEERNWLEAEYMALLINLAEKKLKTKYKKILDIPCGVGRYHRYLRNHGFEVYGVDINENLIKIAKDQNKDFEKYYKVQDMRSINYKEEFDIVINWYTSFGYFSHEENLVILKKFYEALKPKGILILDVPARVFTSINSIKDCGEYLNIERWEKIDYRTMHLRFDLYKKEGNILKHVKSLDLNLMIYPPNELKEMLEESGFEVLFVFKGRSISDVKNRLYDIYDGRLVWICWKSL
ncbi:MAG TPA: class I SAM-dependent methyltransferase [Candidatus Nanopusillus sp.]|nr:class I SAM-dependent methyltransferase [Candidatus Nanopusillus sp.]